ncbi:hypothetical protein N836_18545 [Leptolyngbya sp. Heron Island J]|uniref:hypothetical protein n=1 Tax=Leptolyngbya sp. Heron Island J TaxID=1385935 RepID=UPI0003B9BCFD|nr:hypothetical protein [Leptolyngbya sp. Heron Island J]ESA34131.1 hypothetical protein N836_18545 [Leptolyngbya sp. Heron Island J]
MEATLLSALALIASLSSVLLTCISHIKISKRIHEENKQSSNANPDSSNLEILSSNDFNLEFNELSGSHLRSILESKNQKHLNNLKSSFWQVYSEKIALEKSYAESESDYDNLKERIKLKDKALKQIAKQLEWTDSQVKGLVSELKSSQNLLSKDKQKDFLKASAELDAND